MFELENRQYQKWKTMDCRALKWSAKNIQREGILLEQVHNLATIKIMTRLLKKKKKSRYMVWESTTWKTFDSKEVNTSYTKTSQESFIVHA